MTFRVIAEAAAEQDWREAVEWYEAREAGVGLRFDRAVLEFLSGLARNPERFPAATRLTRKAKMPEPWPFSIFFVINTRHREVKVLAIWHGSRNPDELRKRLK